MTGSPPPRSGFASNPRSPLPTARGPGAHLLIGVAENAEAPRTESHREGHPRPESLQTIFSFLLQYGGKKLDTHAGIGARLPSDTVALDAKLVGG